MDNRKPRVLVLGSTGLIGRAIAAELDDASDRVEVVRASRDSDAVEQWRSEGRPAVQLDLEDARTFPAALEGIDRLFVMTGSPRVESGAGPAPRCFVARQARGRPAVAAPRRPLRTIPLGRSWLTC